MSDRRVEASLDDLEKLLATLMDHPDAEAVATWHSAFKEALAGAEKGPGWPEIAGRGQRLGRLLDERVNQLQALRGAVREELLARTRGRIALSGYKPTPR